jgi:hypothetical protein
LGERNEALIVSEELARASRQSARATDDVALAVMACLGQGLVAIGASLVMVGSGSAMVGDERLTRTALVCLGISAAFAGLAVPYAYANRLPQRDSATLALSAIAGLIGTLGAVTGMFLFAHATMAIYRAILGDNQIWLDVVLGGAFVVGLAGGGFLAPLLVVRLLRPRIRISARSS